MRLRGRCIPLVAAGLLGCAAAGGGAAGGPPAAGDSGGPPDAPPNTSGYVRAIAPFEVRDEHGRPYAHPFLGGLDVPRPQLVDIDADGDADLFVQERSAELMFFENTGTPQQPHFAWRTDAFHGLDIGEWSRVVDVDGDGLHDVLAERRYSYIRWYRNAGTAQQPRFVNAADTLYNVAGEAVFSDRQNIPQAVDLDCDERLDLFLGRVDGTITRYEQAQEQRTPPRFQFVTDRFEGIEIIGQLVGSARHGANSMFFADPDGDGDLDLYWGDFFEPGVLFIENTGSCASPALRGTPRPLMADGDTIATSGYNAPYLVDIDADGRLDLFLGVLGGAFNPNRTSADNFHYYAQQPDGSLTLRTRRFVDGIDVGSESVPGLADLDGDGDLDLLIGNKLDPTTLRTARLFLFRNDGTPTAPAFVLADTLDLPAQYHFAPALADLDGDGLVDMLLGTWNEGVLHFRNEGSRSEPRFVQDTTHTVRLTRGSNATPALGDVDGDGDLDLFVGEASGEVNFFRNTGSARGARFELVSDTFGAIDAGRRSHPALVDIDGDGDLDLLFGREAGGALLYRNQGSRTEPAFVADSSFVLPLHPTAAPVFADLTGDGVPELLVGGLSGGVTYYSRSRP